MTIMTKNLRRESDDSSPGARPFIKKELLLKYKTSVDNAIALRLLIMLPIGIILHIAFSWLDFHFYPNHGTLFLKLRLIDSLLITVFCIPALLKPWRKYCVWMVDLCILLLAGVVIFMIFVTDGASSHYYEGINLSLFAMIILNSFYFWHSFAVSAIILIAYALAAIFGSVGWDASKFWFAFFFVGSTAFFVVLMTKFYSSQHRAAFMRNEELRENERKLEVLCGMAEERSKIDDLTKIYNRRYFFEILTEKIKLCRLAGQTFYLILFDIDHFKPINDAYGHVFGDEVIATVAKVVRNMMRLNSYMGRYGGDEFMLLIDQATPEELFMRMEKISRAIRRLELTCDGKKVELSASFGAARFDPTGGMDEKKLLELADDALLEVKRVQRGGIKLAGS